jgi:maltooligosyltrehalose trehalohydrolase
VTEFRVWAPSATRLELDLVDERVPMRRTGGGWWSVDRGDAGHGTDYAYRIDGGEPMPDPRSRWQPYGVHGRSRVHDPTTLQWTDREWRGVQLPGAVLYELHIGTFTVAGTFDAAIERLDHLVDLGVDLVEVMPVAAFAGRHGWGYDGTHLYAVHEPYGGPDGFARLVEACHARGLGVALDVVYNHVAAAATYLERYGPYFTDTHQTPWGAGVNLDGSGADEVRQWLIDNALMWLRDYHVDALRLDAVHALADDAAIHLLEQLAVEVDVLSTAVRRPLALIAESDSNDPRLVSPRPAGGYGLTAQWNDDFHHALHALLTGEAQGYYADFAADAQDALARTLTRAYFHAGSWSSFRGRRHGRPVDRRLVPGYRFVGYLQTHDQVGNRALGDRISASLSPGQLRIGAALLLTSPFTPMLFMGEEWGAGTPWQYFADHDDPELAEIVRRGRRREFAQHGWSEDDIPDPEVRATFENSKLDWAEPARQPHASILEWYRALIALRRREPALSDPRLDRVAVTFPEPDIVIVQRGEVRVICNLGDRECRRLLDRRSPRVVLASDDRVVLAGSYVTLPATSVAIIR